MNVTSTHRLHPVEAAPLSGARTFTLAVAGSVGKTTALEAIHHLLARRLSGVVIGSRQRTRLSLQDTLRQSEQAGYVAIELDGSNHLDLQVLKNWRPLRIGVVTRLTQPHGSDPQAEANAIELLESLPPHGWAVLDGDDPRKRRLISKTRARVLCVGRGADCDLVATQIRFGNGELSFRVDGVDFCLPAVGRQDLSPLLAAIAVGRIQGLRLEEMAAGLKRGGAAPVRSIPHPGVAGVKILDDSRRNTPAAMRAALERLREEPTQGRRIVICGDLEEPSHFSVSLHRMVGEEVVTVSGADGLIAVGRYAEHLLAGACTAGLPRHCGMACESLGELPAAVARLVSPGDLLLVRGGLLQGLSEATRAALGNRLRQAV